MTAFKKKKKIPLPSVECKESSFHNACGNGGAPRGAGAGRGEAKAAAGGPALLVV